LSPLFLLVVILVYETSFISLGLGRRLLLSDEGTVTSLAQVDDAIVTWKSRSGSFEGWDERLLLSDEGTVTSLAQVDGDLVTWKPRFWGFDPPDGIFYVL